MKRLFILFVLGAFTTTLFAQQSGIVPVKMRDVSSCYDGYANSNPVPYSKTHLYKKQQMPAVNGTGQRAVTTVQVGSAGNLFTIIDGQVNSLAADNATNTVAFIHRTNPDVFPGNNVGQYRYDVSADGGANWTINQGLLNPSGDQTNFAGRYPQAVIYNPQGNTDTDNAWLSYQGTWLPFNQSGSNWDGTFAGVAQLDNDTTTFTENIFNLNNNDIYISHGLTQSTPGVFWAVNFVTPDGLPTAATDIILYKGQFLPGTNDVNWVIDRFFTPNWDQSFDGSTQATSLNMAFGPNGQYGWISFLGDISSGGDNIFTINFYYTEDGGNTWNGPEVVDLNQIDNVVNNLDPQVGLTATTAFDADIVVDANGNPHLAVVVGSSGADYSISTGVQAGLRIYDITRNPAAAAECEWMAIDLDSVATFRGDITTDVSDDNRPQASISPSGEQVFFSWLDSDPDPNINPDGSNALPNYKTRGVDVNTGLATPVVNWTINDPVWSGGALFGTLSPNSLKSGSTYTLPSVFTQLNPTTGSDADPTFFHYAQDVTYDESDFADDVMPPVITLNGQSPVTVNQGGTYSEAGASALDNVDGDISGSVTTTGTVDENTPGTYTITYSVADAAGNEACVVTRTVNVVASPDNTPPVITLNGNDTITLDVCDFFVDPGATATDDVDGDISNNIDTTSTVVTGQTGTYTIDYDVSDGAGNAATTVTRVVIIQDNPPTISLAGGDTINISACTAFNDPGAVAFDNCAGPLNVTVSGTVDTNTTGTYTLTYSADDGVNPPVTADRTVIVVPDNVAPVITLNGDNPAFVYLGDSYTDAGATATDNCDGNLTSSITVTGNVNTTSRDTVTITYNVTDAEGNSATPVTREVIINTEPDPAFGWEHLGNGVVAFTDSSLYDPTDWQWEYQCTGFSSGVQNPQTTIPNGGECVICLTATNVFNDPPFNQPAQTVCDTININVGISELQLQGAIDLFPNPTTGSVNIQFGDINFEEAKITVFDMVGTQLDVIEGRNLLNKGNYSYDISNNADGVYFFRVETDLGVVTKKVTLFSNN